MALTNAAKQLIAAAKKHEPQPNPMAKSKALIVTMRALVGGEEAYAAFCDAELDRLIAEREDKTMFDETGAVVRLA